MNLIAAYAHSTWATGLKRLQNWARCGVLALTSLLGAGQAWAGDPFVDNGDGTVTDTSTGLMWDQCADGLSGSTCTDYAAVHYTWADALGQAVHQNRGNYKGYSDWRLPSVVELKTLVKGSTGPTIDTTAFPNTAPAGFWSGTTYAPVPSGAWIVNFDNGYTGAYDKSGTYFVRLVRSGQYFGSFGLFPVGVSGITATAATLTATSATGAIGHWLVVPRNATPPTWAQIISGASYPTVTVAAYGSGAMTASPATLPLAGLAAGTSYDLYMVARESTYQTTSNISGPVPFSTLAISTSSIVIDPVNAQIVYSGTDGAGVYKSTNAGVAWTAANSTLGGTQRVKALLIKPGTSGTTGANATLFAATYGNGVFKSTDSAATWSACNSVSLGNLNVLSLGMNASASTLYAGTEAGVFVSSDDCANWTAMNTGMP